MLLGIDLDEIVADSLDAIIKFHNEKYKTNLKKDNFVSYRFWEIWGGTKEESVKKISEFFKTDHLANIYPIAGSLGALADLKKSGHELFIITGRRNEIIKQTEEWIEKHFPNIFSGAHFANSYTLGGHERKKSDICKKLGVELIIEDDLLHATDCAKNGIKVFLFDYPWNQGNLSPNIERVFSWSEIVDKLVIRKK